MLEIAIPVMAGANIANYLNALSALGAEGVMTDGHDAAGFDGLLLPGGWDADPSLYGEENAGSLHINRALDDMQLRALDVFLGAGKPVFGICRGLQMMNVFFGGTLIQDIPAEQGHHRAEGSPRDSVHVTTAEQGSFLDRLYGPRFAVNSSHHQSVDRAGEGLRAVQWSDDGIVEGVEHASLPVWGVQWHPERMCFAHARNDTVDGSAVICMFLNECQRRL